MKLPLYRCRQWLAEILDPNRRRLEKAIETVQSVVFDFEAITNKERKRCEDIARNYDAERWLSTNSSERTAQNIADLITGKFPLNYPASSSYEECYSYTKVSRYNEEDC